MSADQASTFREGVEECAMMVFKKTEQAKSKKRRAPGEVLAKEDGGTKKMLVQDPATMRQLSNITSQMETIKDLLTKTLMQEQARGDKMLKEQDH